MWGNDFEDETYNPKCDNPELSNVIMTLERLDPLPKQYADNLTKSERKAIDEIKILSRSDIVIKKADKGNTLVIIDKSFYRDKLVLQDHLNSITYRPAELNSDMKVMKHLTSLMDKHRLCLSDKEYEYITSYEWKTSNFYILPKIHKCQAIIDKL